MRKEETYFALLFNAGDDKKKAAKSKDKGKDGKKKKKKDDAKDKDNKSKKKKKDKNKDDKDPNEGKVSMMTSPEDHGKVMSHVIPFMAVVKDKATGWEIMHAIFCLHEH